MEDNKLMLAKNTMNISLPTPDQLMGTKEVAELFSISTPAVTNFQKRYNDFPKPYVTLAATPIFLKNEIIDWANKHSRMYKAQNINKAEWGQAKIIAYVGRPRVGKSFCISEFLNNTMQYRNAASKSGADCTQCPVIHYIKDNIVEEFAIFHNKSLNDYTPDDDGMNGYQSPLIEDKFTIFMTEVNNYLKERKKNNTDEQIIVNSYIEIYARPSAMAKEIMRNANISSLIIIDTPGVAENYGMVPIEKADLVVLVAADSNRVEAQNSYTEIIKKMKPLLSTSRFCFLYRTSSSVDDLEEYIDCQNKAKEAMKSFEENFSDLRKSDIIIETEMEVLHPANTVIGIPNMSDKKIKNAETFFMQEIIDKFSTYLYKKKIDMENLKNELLQAQKDGLTFDTVKEFIQRLLSAWTYTSLNARINTDIKYTLENFKNEKHSRVMTQDNYRLLQHVNMARRMHINELYNNFKNYTCTSNPLMWQQLLIKYVYITITDMVKNDTGLLIGKHPWESYPPVTLYAIESILSEHLLELMKNKDTFLQNAINYMIEYNVKSNTWNYVNLNNDPNASIKLQLINILKLNKIHTSSCYDMVYNRYTLGLHMLGVYEIYKYILDLFTESNDIFTELENSFLNNTKLN